MPRDQATMPYWVPRVLRFHKKVRRRLSEQRGLRVRVGFPRDLEKRGRGWVLFPQRLPLVFCGGGVL